MIRTLTFFAVLILGAVAAQGQDAGGPLTLDAVVRTYIDKNLELQAAQYRLERARTVQIEALVRPNPGFTVTAENFAVGGPVPFNDLYEVAATYSETIELGGKRKLRQQAADLAVSAAEAQFADVMRRGVAEVKRLYYDAVLTQYKLEVANEDRQTFGQLLQLSQARFEEGAIPESDLIKVRLERMKFDSAVRQAELNLRQATIRLLERIGESDFAKADVAGEITFTPANPSLESLRQLALAERTDVKAAVREVEAAEGRVLLEKARARPDILPFAGYKRVAADNTLLFGVSIPLKIRDRNQAGIARAETDVKAARTRLQIIRNRTRAEVESAYEAFRTAREQVQTFRDELLNQADESRTIALAAYEEGGTDLLPLLEAQRTRAEVRRQYFETLFEYQSSLIDLELAVGREIQP